jgi:SAM-dependent methyltransferase
VAQRQPSAGEISPDVDPAWQDLDLASEPERLLRFLDAIAAVPAMAAAKQRSFTLLGVGPGDRLLDAGCGTGLDALVLADRVSPGGEVVGVDTSELVIEQALRNAGDRRGLRFKRANIADLPFATGTFDAARADRTLIHILRADAAVSELARVTRPGGRLVLTEVTFAQLGHQRGSTPEAGPDRRRGQSRHLNAFLPFLLAQAGVEHIAVEASRAEIEVDAEMASVIGARAGPIELQALHVAGTVAGSSPRPSAAEG